MYQFVNVESCTLIELLYKWNRIKNNVAFEYYEINCLGFEASVSSKIATIKGFQKIESSHLPTCYFSSKTRPHMLFYLILYTLFFIRTRLKFAHKLRTS